MDPQFKRRLSLFAIVTIAAVIAAVLYVAHAAQRIRNADVRDHGGSNSSGSNSSASISSASQGTLAEVRARPHVMFLASDGGATGHLALAPLDDPSQRIVTDVECVRFHYAHGSGVALGGPNAPGGAWFLDGALKKTRAISIQGVPSRARVSPDGRRAAMTFFVTGDSYESSGFSTRSYVIDLTDPVARPADLEDFALLRDGRKVDAPDINYWGVTFQREAADFFATVSTNGRRHLARCQSGPNEAVVVHDEIECPSLSPNGRSIAFKRRVEPTTPIEWRLAVLDLASDRVRDLHAEERNVDDQVEWLDDDHLLYAIRAQPKAPPDVWILASDDRSEPKLFLKGAFSPAVVR